MTVTLAIFFVITLLVAFFVAMPMLQARTHRFGLGKFSSNHGANDLIERKEGIYSAIKEIEFDYQMGKLSEEDFKALRQQYKDEAVNLLKKIEQIQRKPARPAGRAKKPTEQKSPNFCWVCGTAVTKSDKFCANCGTKIQEQ